MPPGPPSGPFLFCADTTVADRAATIAAASIEVFIVIFPLMLNKLMFPLELPATDRDMHNVRYEDKPE
jgi:hypothetical protein